MIFKSLLYKYGCWPVLVLTVYYYYYIALEDFWYIQSFYYFWVAFVCPSYTETTRILLMGSETHDGSFGCVSVGHFHRMGTLLF